MNLNQDKVPVNLEDALTILKEGLSPEDITELKEPSFSPAVLHHSVGQMLRNEWSLWENDTILVQWFKKRYGVDHADDISGIILDCLWKDINENPRRDEELAKKYIQHWKDQK